MGRMRTLTAVAVTGVIVAGGATGCGSVAKKALEKATGCKEVNVDDKNVSAKCRNGDVAYGAGTKYPDGYPDELKPAGATLVGATKSTTSGTVFSVTASVPGAAKDVAKKLKQQLTGAKYTIEDDSLAEGSDGVGGSLRAHGSTYGVIFSFGSNPKNGSTGTYVIIAVHELTADEKRDLSTTTTTEESSGDDGSDGSSPTTTESGSATDPGSSSSSSSGSLPDGFPADLAPPSSAKITAANKATVNGTTIFSVAASVPGSVGDVYKALKAQVTGAGYTIAGDVLTNGSAGSFGSITGSNGTYDLAATLGLDSDSSSRTMVTMTLTQK